MMSPLLPMLATACQPFDSAEHLFEVKWDGVRGLAAIEDGQWRLWGREGAEYTDRYPELSVLRRLPSGTTLDGELVILKDGRADLAAVLGRHQLSNPERIRHASRRTPIRYMLFDILCHRGRSLLKEPLYRRRAILTDLMNAIDAPELLFSDGMTLLGKEFFKQAVAQGHEGVVAKHLASDYRPGQRSAAWRKIKPTSVLPCAIIGFTPGPDGFASLLVAAPHAGHLRYVGELTGGFRTVVKVDLTRRLAQRRRSRPIVPCSKHAVWVEPDLYCQVRFLRWTPHGRLREAVFHGLLSGSA
jgi:bifunctional non-homologous end joining protein LigD